MSAEVVWSLPKRIAFRFGFIVAVLFAYPAPFGIIPKTDWIATKLGKPWEWLVTWFTQVVVGQTPPIQQTGSGDTLFGWMSMLAILVLAALGAGVWSALDRKRLAYPRLALATWVGLRYLLAMTLFTYGFIKMFEGQFPPPGPLRLDERVGDMSPMGMLWTFQGSSQPYTMFAGLAEVLGGALLLWRRTATLGALVAMGVMTNVVMLNFCYDVPVKLYSSQLLIIAGFIAMPQLRRVLLALLGYAVPEVAPRARSGARTERARLVVKIVAIGCMATNIYLLISGTDDWKRAPSELQGIWKADTTEPWCKLIFTDYGVWTKTCDGKGMPAMSEVLPGAQVVVVKSQQGSVELWHYKHDGDRLTLDLVRGGKPLHVTAKREPPPLLVARGFHWIQEFPFNR